MAYNETYEEFVEKLSLKRQQMIVIRHLKYIS